MIRDYLFPVAPLAGAWIEIHTHLKSDITDFQSRPLRERGLKYRETA